jgi:hypothetical protein
VVGALRDFEEAAGDVEEVVPQLRVMGHHLDELVQGGDRIRKEVVNLSCRVI